MKKRFYEEPEIEVMTYSLTNIITESPGEDDDLEIEDVVPGDGNGSGSGGSTGGDWGWPY